MEEQAAPQSHGMAEHLTAPSRLCQERRCQARPHIGDIGQDRGAADFVDAMTVLRCRLVDDGDDGNRSFGHGPSHVERVATCGTRLGAPRARHLLQSGEPQRDRHRLGVATGVPIQLGQGEHLEGATRIRITMVVDNSNRCRHMTVVVSPYPRQITPRVEQ